MSAVVPVNNTEALIESFYRSLLADLQKGEKLEGKNLRKAAAQLVKVPKAKRKAAWQDVVEAVPTQVNAELLAKFQAHLAAQGTALRPNNNFVALLNGEKIRQANFSAPAIEQAALLAVAKEALKTAILSQVNESSARKLLCSVVAQVSTLTQVEFVKAVWPAFVSDKELNLGGVQTLAQVALQLAGYSLSPQQFEAVVNEAIVAGKEGVSSARAGVDPQGSSPVNGKALLEQKLKQLSIQQNTQEMVYDPDRIRVEAYEAIIAPLYSHPVVKRILPALKRTLKARELKGIGEQAMEGGLVITKEKMALAVAQPYARVVYELAQKVGRELGFSEEVTQVISSSPNPNAFVFTFDSTSPRVTFFSAMLEKYWDNDAGDWIKINVDEKGALVAAGTPNSREIKAGEKAIEFILSHELGHIRDQIMLTRSLVVYLFLATAKNILAKKGKSSEDEAKLEEAMALFWARSSCNCCAAVNQEMPRELLQQLAGMNVKLSQKEAVDVLRKMAKGLGKDFGAGADVTMEELLEFVEALGKMGRAAESTADRYALINQGTATWGSLTFAMLNLDITQSTSSLEKRRSIERLIAMNPEKYADTQLADLSAMAEDVYSDADKSHPVGPARIKQQFLYSRDPESHLAAVQEWRKLPPELRLLGTIQLYEKSLSELTEEYQATKPQNSLDLLSDLLRQQNLEVEGQELRRHLQPFLDLCVEHIKADGMGNPKNRYLDQVISFIEEKGFAVAAFADFNVLVKQLFTVLTKAMNDGSLGEAEQAATKARLKRLKEVVVKQAHEEMKRRQMAQLMGLRG